MALAFAHTTAGYLAYEAVRPAGAHRPGLLLAGVALANGPDADFLPGLLIGHASAYHRGVTHTVVAVAAVGLVAVFGARLAGRSPGAAARAALWVAAVWASHLLVDFVTIDSVAPYGVRLLWPFSQAYYIAPVTVLDETVIDSSGRIAFFRSVLTPHALAVWGHELLFLVGVVLAVHLARGWLARGVASLDGVAEES